MHGIPLKLPLVKYARCEQEHAGWMCRLSSAMVDGQPHNAPVKFLLTMEIAQVKLIKRHTSTVWDAQFSPDAKLFASASRDYSAVIWDTQARITYVPLNRIDLEQDTRVEAYGLCLGTRVASL